MSGNYFDALGVKPAQGRFFLRRGGRRAGSASGRRAPPRYWPNELGGDGGASGDTLRVNGQPFTVIGIAPPGFDGLNVGFAPAAWLPMAMNRRVPPDDATNWYEQRRGLFVNSVGRLRAGVDRAGAQADLDLVGGALEREYPDDNQGRGLAVLPIAETTLFNREQLAAGSATLQTTVGARAPDRLRQRREPPARSRRRAPPRDRDPPGDGRHAARRLVRQLLTESLVVALPRRRRSVCVAAFAGRDLLRGLLGSPSRRWQPRPRSSVSTAACSPSPPRCRS